MCLSRSFLFVVLALAACRTTTQIERVFELGRDVNERNGSGFSIKLADALPEGMSIEEAEFSFLAQEGPDQAFAATLPIIKALEN